VQLPFFILFYIPKGRNAVKKTDFVLIAVILLVAAGFYGLNFLHPSKEGAVAVVLIDGEEYGSYPLEQDATYDIVINGHTNTLQIKDGYADMISADCPDQLCVKQRKIHYENETIVCLPNKLVVEIRGGAENSVDAVVQ
jgi:hypothetical protein